ncbi:MAG: hypothetical protein O3C21_13265 [Verrucomicrobia bacterium]|nr:hypothetical protein [Verrucomicrobiota bacterium]
MNLTDTASVFRGGALAFLLSAILALPASAASPEAEANSRLLDQVEPRLKAIYESDEFRMRSFKTQPGCQTVQAI